MLQRLYARTLAIAAGPNALWALLTVSFAESSFFPIPPDILLIPMILARPREAFRLAGGTARPSHLHVVKGRSAAEADPHDTLGDGEIAASSRDFVDTRAAANGGDDARAERVAVRPARREREDDRA